MGRLRNRTDQEVCKRCQGIFFAIIPDRASSAGYVVEVFRWA
jgi:hypothetical protein